MNVVNSQGLSPATIAGARDAIAALARACRAADPEARAGRIARLEHIYGELGGQRALDTARINAALGHAHDPFDTHDLVIALEAWFAIVCLSIAAMALHDDAQAALDDLSEAHDFRDRLAAILDGTAFEAFVVFGLRDAADLGWLTGGLGDADMAVVQETLRRLGRWLEADALRRDDPFQAIHRQLFPRNLMHVTGQFYTPGWLAERLLEDLGWTGEGRLTDPFCGSGIFLVRAIERGIAHGFGIVDLLDRCAGIDLNPTACVAAHCNLVLKAAIHRRDRTRVTIRVFNADSLEPAIAGAAPLLEPADVVATNPPWVGWEYMSRPYRAYVQPAWDAYGLFTARGLESSFVKEDLSTLALVVAWDLYLKDGGRTVTVIKPSTMKADLTGRGIRRLSLTPGGIPMRLERVRAFDGIEVFADARTDTCAWQLTKGAATEFPVPVMGWTGKGRWKPDAAADLADIEASVREDVSLLVRADPSDPGSRWMIADRAALAAFDAVRGTNALTPRMGVFTGGANALYYVEPAEAGEGASLWRNVVERAKRPVPQYEMRLEDALVRPVLRGRDISPWRAEPGGRILFPHTPQTRMYPILEAELARDYPLAHAYLAANRAFLEARGGFAGWEKKVHAAHYHTLQRIGDYTFQPYKLCWRYFADAFTVCVLGATPDEYVVVPNDKVMFIGFDDRDEAFYYGGILSSALVRACIDSGISKRQISTRAIQSIKIAPFDADDPVHMRVSRLCLSGHLSLKAGALDEAEAARAELDQIVAAIYRRG